MRAGLILRDLPVRVSTLTFRDPAIDTLRVIVRADIGTAHRLRPMSAWRWRSSTTAASWPDRRPASSGWNPIPRPDGAWSYMEALNLRPGTYTLRLAAADAAGRIGTVAHHFQAKLETGAGGRMSDILLVDADRSDRRSAGAEPGRSRQGPDVVGRRGGVSGQ